MQVNLRLFIPLLLLLLLAGCAQAQVEVVPTLMQVVPPSETPTPRHTNTPLARPTLPPTWTPTGEVAPTDATQVAPTAGVNSTFEAILERPSFEGRCDSFGVVPGTPTTVVVGNSVEVAWTPPVNITSYEISLIDQTGSPVVVRRTEGTRYTFEASLFPSPYQLYGWLVVPYDEYNTPVCTPRGAELRTLPS